MARMDPKHRINLEAALLSRWQARHVDAILRALEQWSGWRWPTEPEVLAAIPYVSKPIRARYLRAAQADLASLLALPPVTPREERVGIEQRVAFGVLPPAALVRPEDRMLSPWHGLAIIGRGLPMLLAICRTIGGMTLVPFATLEAELEREQDAQAVRFLKLEHAATLPDRHITSGPSVAGFTF